MSGGETSKNRLLALDDLRYAAYAYYEELSKNNIKAAVEEFFYTMKAASEKDKMKKTSNEKEKKASKKEEEANDNNDKKDLIPFESFKAHMTTVLPDEPKYASEKFYAQLATGGASKDKLQYKDIVTLLFIINTGRPFCQRCKRFVEGLFFTCVQCFHEEKDYHFNFCTWCYNDFLKKPHKHKELGDHKKLPGHAHFLDPVTLLLLKVKKESGPTSQQSTPRSSSSTAIIAAQPQIKKNDLLKLVKFVVDCISVGTTVAQLCTIM